MSLRSVLHEIVDELPVSSEGRRDVLHAKVDAATPEPTVAPPVTPPSPFDPQQPPVS